MGYERHLHHDELDGYGQLCSQYDWTLLRTLFKYYGRLGERFVRHGVPTRGRILHGCGTKHGDNE